MSSSGRNSLHWFRKGLRLHDNPALDAALKNTDQLYPVFVLDPWFVKEDTVGVNRMRFLLESLQDLDSSLRKRDSRLFVARGNPIHVLPKLWKQWNISTMTYEMDTEPYALKRDKKVQDLGKEHNVTIQSFSGHTLYDMDKIVSKAGSNIPTTYSSFCKLLGTMGHPKQPTSAPSESNFVGCSNSNDFNSEQYDTPTLHELNYSIPKKDHYLKGGESESLKRLDRYMKQQDWVTSFQKPKTNPTALSPDTTALSPYMKFGCLSARKFYWEVKRVYNASTEYTKPPESLHGQLLWREFFYLQGYKIKGYDNMKENKLCRKIPWDNTPELLQAWQKAQTGYPWIDAAMTQLKEEGWLHHLARHAVACFLTRGDLYQSWEAGAKVFDRLLIDADWSINIGNWLWLSASAYFYQFFRVYSPISFPKKTDKNGDYVRKYIPKLAKFPAKYIYEPWKAPLSVQRECGCIIGKDYPKPIVDHTKASQRAKDLHKEAYDKNKQMDCPTDLVSGAQEDFTGSEPPDDLFDSISVDSVDSEQSPHESANQVDEKTQSTNDKRLRENSTDTNSTSKRHKSES